MNIDYSIPKNKKNSYFLYSNFVFGAKHIGLACTKQLDLPLVERIKHLVLGVFECIPILGHVISSIDRKVSHINARIQYLNQETPHERGFAHGKAYRNEIQTLYKFVKNKIERLDKGSIPLFSKKEKTDYHLFITRAENHSRFTENLDDQFLLNYWTETTIGFGSECKDDKEYLENLIKKLKHVNIQELEYTMSDIAAHGFRFRLTKKCHDQSYHKEWTKKLEGNLNDKVKEEMRGIAKGAKVPYEDVVLVNTFLDRYPGTFGCSALATIVGNNNSQRLAAANDFVSCEYTCERFTKLNQANIDSSLASQKKALEDVSNKSTLQSIVFDVNKGDLHVSASSDNAATKRFTKVSNVFKKTVPQNSRNIKLSRNLDWNWPIATRSMIVVKEGVASVTWPGFLGALSAMNEHGVSLASCSVGNSVNKQGFCVHLLQHEILTEAKTVKQALRLFKKYEPACSLNVTLAGPDGIARVELDPARKKIGAASVVFEKIA